MSEVLESDSVSRLTAALAPEVPFRAPDRPRASGMMHRGNELSRRAEVNIWHRMRRLDYQIFPWGELPSREEFDELTKRVEALEQKVAKIAP
jgi:hypothetical protein